MLQNLPIIVKFTVKEEKLDYFKNEMLNILEPTRKEDGCILYQLHQDIDKPNILMFYEIWKSVDDWKKHDKMPYIVHIKNVIEECVETVTFNKLKVL